MVNISSSISSASANLTDKKAYKIGNICFITVVGTASSPIAAYGEVLKLNGFTFKMPQYFKSDAGKDFVAYASNSSISTRISISTGENVSFSTILLLN